MPSTSSRLCATIRVPEEPSASVTGTDRTRHRPSPLTAPTVKVSSASSASSAAGSLGSSGSGSSSTRLLVGPSTTWPDSSTTCTTNSLGSGPRPWGPRERVGVSPSPVLPARTGATPRSCSSTRSSR